jgi:hypothetical protein
MRMPARPAVLFGCLMLGGGTATGWADEPSKQEFLCAQGATTRVVSIVTTAASDERPRGSCRVDYTKDSVTKTLWSSSTGHGYCIKKATAFVTKLAEEHYSCSLKTKEPDQ